MSVPQPRVSELDTADAALLDTLLREAPIGFALLGPDLCFRRVNDTLARLHGHDPEDHIGQMPADVSPAEFAAEAESSARRVLTEDQPVFGARQILAPAVPAAPVIPAAPAVPGDSAAALAPDARPAPETVHWALSWFPSHDGKGQISGVVLIAVDVTSRHLLSRPSGAARSGTARSSRAARRWSGSRTPTVRSPRTARSGAGSPGDPGGVPRVPAGSSRSTPRTGTGSRGTGAAASRPARPSTTGTAYRTRAGPTGTTTSAPCRSSGTAGSSSGWGRAPTSPASVRPRRCAGRPSSCRPRRCGPRGCSRRRPCWPRR